MTTTVQPTLAPAVERYHWGDHEPHSTDYLWPVLLRMVGVPTIRTTILDLGCGTGTIGAKFWHMGARVTGVDPSTDALKIFHERHADCDGFYFVHAPADEQLSSRLGQQYDVVLATEVVEHLYDPLTFAQAAYEALKPGGRFIVSTPYHGYLKNLCLSLRGYWDFHHSPMHMGGHIKFWSPRTLTQLLTTAGFEVIDFQGAGRCPYLWKSMVMSAIKAP